MSGYVAPQVSNLASEGCTEVSPGNYEHRYHVTLTGGSDWYYQGQNAPHADIHGAITDAYRNLSIDYQEVGVGSDPSHSTGQVRVNFPYAVSSNC